ncbi:undecaprenyl-phosphate 4-deoxy-4-formamido-L-arabinose transferase [soil metagenome]
MEFFPVFLSVVLVVRNQSAELESMLTAATQAVASTVSDYEIVIVDNASDDDSVAKLKHLTGAQGIPNLQVYALTKEVDPETASWVGLENALGDFVAVIDPLSDDIGFLPTMLEKAAFGADVVFARNEFKSTQSLLYRVGHRAFHAIYKWFNGIHLATEAPQYRMLSRSVVNYILQHSQPAMTYRHLPVTGGFARANLSYRAEPKSIARRPLGENIDRAVRLLVSTTRAPMRLVTTLGLFGAISNLVYSGYVIGVAILRENVAPGWVTLSLQQSGMFFLISLVLLVLGEYILHMGVVSNDGPSHHISQEFTSTRMTTRQKLNVEEAGPLLREPGDRSQRVPDAG